MSWISKRLRLAHRPLAIGSLSLCLVLIGCGEDDDDADTTGRTDETAVTSNLIDASPAASAPARSGFPQDANSATVSIADGRLDPDSVEGQTGLPFILIVNGDGTEHTLEIEGLVNETTISAEGQTEVSFTVSDDTTGDLPITLDGEEAGTFIAQQPGGIVDE